MEEAAAGGRLGHPRGCGRSAAGDPSAPWVPLEHARTLVELYAETGSPKYERAALKHLGRCLAEADPSLADVAQLVGVLSERAMLTRGR